MGRYVSKEEQAIIADCLLKKMTATQIAAIVNRSRGSIAGIVWRDPELRKIGFTKPVRTTEPSKWETEKQRRAIQLRDVVPGRHSLRKRPTLMELTSSACRFPIEGDGAATLFCAESRVADSSYCEFHRRMCAGAVRGAA